MSGLISVIIPTYNRADRIGVAVESVLAQTDRDWELIIVDDGSTDDTETVVQSFDDDRIKYIRQENHGVSAARNQGIKRARGGLIAFLDSDDRWEPRKSEVQRRFFESHPDVHICQTEEKWIRNGLRVNPMKKHKKPSGWIFKECLDLCVVSPSAVMLRCGVFDSIGLFDETLAACEDYDFWLRSSLVFEIVTLPDMLTVKIGGHRDQLSRQWGLDRYRIMALENLFHNSVLPDIYRPLVMAQIDKRIEIMTQGALKHGNRSLLKEIRNVRQELPW